MTDYKDKSSSPTRLYNLSPEKYGKSAFKELSYTPEKLSENFLYKEITVNKKMECEKKRIRELESDNTICHQKIRQLETQNQTIKKSLLLQIEMYKKMIKDQEQEKAKHIRSIQHNFNLEIEKLLEEHQEESKVAQAQKEQFQRKIQQLLEKLEATEYQLHVSNTEGQELSNKLNLTTQQLGNTKEKLQRTQQLNRVNIERANKEISSLNQRIQSQRNNFRGQLQSTVNEKNREIESINKMHTIEIQKLENRRSAEMAEKNLQLKELASTFEAEGRRLDEIINNKDRTNTNVTNELNKQKQRVLALTKHYENELNQLLNQKERLLNDLQVSEGQKNRFKITTQQLEVELDNERNQSDTMIGSLKAQLNHKTIELARENQNLIRAVDQYQQEIGYLRNENRQIQHEKHLDTTKIKISNEHYSQENRLLLVQIKNLRDVLLESSLEMEKCKEEFIRMDHDRERLMRLTRDYEDQNIRFKTLLTEKQLQVRQWRDSYFGLKARY